MGFFGKRFKDETVKNYKSNYVHPKAEVPRCSSCGLRMRRAGHENGDAHSRALKKAKK